MSPYAVLGLSILAVLATMILALSMSPRTRSMSPSMRRRRRHPRLLSDGTDISIMTVEEIDRKMESLRRKAPMAKPRSYDEYDPPTAANAYHTAKGPVPTERYDESRFLDKDK